MKNVIIAIVIIILIVLGFMWYKNSQAPAPVASPTTATTLVQ